MAREFIVPGQMISGSGALDDGPGRGHQAFFEKRGRIHSIQQLSVPSYGYGNQSGKCMEGRGTDPE